MHKNLLQDAGTSAEVTAVPAYTGTSGSLSTNAWPPVKGAVTAYAKQTDGKEIVHLLNFINADSLSWRDLNGTVTFTLPNLKYWTMLVFEFE